MIFVILARMRDIIECTKISLSVFLRLNLAHNYQQQLVTHTYHILYPKEK